MTPAVREQLLSRDDDDALGIGVDGPAIAVFSKNIDVTDWSADDLDELCAAGDRLVKAIAPKKRARRRKTAKYTT